MKITFLILKVAFFNIPLALTHSVLFSPIFGEAYSTARALDIKGNGSGGVLRNLQLKWIQPYLSDQLKEWILWATNEKIKPIKVLFGPPIIPFKASFLVDICKAYILANNDKHY